MKKEIDFTLELCQYINPNEEKINTLIKEGLDYPFILGHLLFNRVGGAAYYTLQKLSLLGKMNREVRNILKTVHESNVIKSESFKKSLCYLSKIFKDVRFPYALLKGSFLVNLYPLGLRTSNDIDVLLNFKDSTKISKLLIDNGFVQGNIRNGEFIKASRAEIISSQINRGETVPFIKEINLPYMRFLEIDVNFSLDFKPEENKSIVAELLENAVPDINTSDGVLYTLSKEDFLIQLCVHLYKEAAVYNWVAFGRDQGLYKYLDIYLFILTYLNEEMAVNLAEKIKAFEIEKECFYALNGTKELFNLRNIQVLDILLENIKPLDTEYLNEIIDPSNGKKYKFDINFKNWVFCGKRSEMLFNK